MSKNLYFLIYKTNGKRTELILREPTLDSRDFIKVRGERADKSFKSIISVLDVYALRYNVLKSGNEVIVELPADIGYAVLLYLLLTYNVRKPEKHVYFLERLLAGKIPLSKYFDIFIDMAIDLSDLKSNSKHRRTAIDSTAAKVISSMMRILTRNL